MMPLLERVLSNIETLPWSGCWIYMGHTNGVGYGHIKVAGYIRPNGKRTCQACHRLAEKKYLSKRRVQTACAEAGR